MRNKNSFIIKALSVFGVVAAMHGAAPAMADGAPVKTEDPLESVNRVTSDFNAGLRKHVLDPLVDGYRAIAPEDFQKAISNIFSNLSEPVTAASSLIQGDANNASVATQRFLLNSTVGIGGIGDPAKEQGLEQRKEDLGQAMGANGVAPGPHIVLPIFGPSNLRDATADIAVGILSPAPLAVKAVDGGVAYTNKKDTIKALNEGSLDRYAVERDAYEQNRQFQVDNGRGPAMAFPDINADDNPAVAEKKAPIGK